MTLFSLFLACGGSRANITQDQKEAGSLGKSVDIYWRAVRWGDADGAKTFVEGPDEKYEFDSWLHEHHQAWKYTDVEVVKVTLRPESTEPSRTIRDAEVIVRTEGYGIKDNVLEQDTVVQRWYRTDAQWFVEWEEEQ